MDVMLESGGTSPERQTELITINSLPTTRVINAFIILQTLSDLIDSLFIKFLLKCFYNLSFTVTVLKTHSTTINHITSQFIQL